MLDAFIIEELERLRREQEPERPRLELPLPVWEEQAPESAPRPQDSEVQISMI